MRVILRNAKFNISPLIYLLGGKVYFRARGYPFSKIMSIRLLIYVF